MKVYFAQTPNQMAANTGIGRVLHAQYKYLPEFDIVPTNDKDSADLFVGHTCGDDLPSLDVLHCHGLYWTADAGGKYNTWHHEANRRMLADARRAITVTVPSRWVAEPFHRDMRIRPVVIGHGIEVDEWQPTRNEGFLFWGKGRVSDVCDPTAVFALAEHGLPVVMPQARVNGFVPSGVRMIGEITDHRTNPLTHEEMIDTLSRASVYLATTQETFGINTLEALASGVPVLGYRHGATPDLVEHQANGYLVEPGDIDGLIAGYDWIMDHWQALHSEAIARTRSAGWRDVIQRYAECYHQTKHQQASEARTMRDSAIIITTHNYGQYLDEAISSAKAQEHPPAEIVVVDDASTDDTADVLARHPDVQVVRFGKNQGVAAARMAGVEATSAPFVVFLDADDTLDPRFLSMLLPAMRDRGVGIAYSGLAVRRGNDLSHNRAWPPAFSWDQQTQIGPPPGNCIPSACLVRRSMLQRAGHFITQAYAPGEDAELWTRGLAAGFTAVRVTDLPLFLYRVHEGSATRTKTYRRIDSYLPWLRDRRYPMAAPLDPRVGVDGVCPLVRSYNAPLVTITLLRPTSQQIESIVGQTVRAWDLRVTERSIKYCRASYYPFLALDTDTGKPCGALHITLDHSEQLPPRWLEDALRAYATTGDLGDFMGCGCTSVTPTGVNAALPAVVGQPSEIQPRGIFEPDAVRLKYTGARAGYFSITGAVTQQVYRMSKNAPFVDASPADVDSLLGMSEDLVVPMFVRVNRPQPLPESDPDVIDAPPIGPQVTPDAAATSTKKGAKRGAK